MMLVEILDAQTGERRQCHDWPSPGFEFDVWWWSAGNGSCDCNRALAFDAVDEGDDGERVGRCLGCRRFLISGVSGDLDGMSEEEVLREVNREYPLELLERHGLPTP